MNPIPAPRGIRPFRLSWIQALVLLGAIPSLLVGSLRANQNPTVTIIPQGPVTDLATPAVVSFGFDATDPDGQVVAVDVFDNGGWITSLTNRPFQLSREWWAGAHRLRARARDNEGGIGLSTPIPFTVQAPSPVVLKPVRRDGADLVLEWSGGKGPFLVEMQSDLRDAWTILEATGTNRTARVPVSDTHLFLQVNDTAVSATRNYDAALSGTQVLPAPIDTPATAVASMRLFHSTVTFRIDYSGLTTPLSAVRVHGPAATNQVGPAVLDLTAFHVGPVGTSGSLSGSLVLSAEQKLAFLGGKTYVTLVESGKTTESIRGQLLPRPLGYEKDHDNTFTFDVSGASASEWVFEFGAPVVTSGQNPGDSRPYVSANAGNSVTFTLTCGRKNDSNVATSFQNAGFSSFNPPVSAHLHIDGGTAIPTGMNFYFPVTVMTDQGLVLQMYLGQNGSGKGWKGDLKTVGEAAKDGYDAYKDLEQGKWWDSLKSCYDFLKDLTGLGSENTWSLTVVGTPEYPAFIADLQYTQNPYPYVYTTSQLNVGGVLPDGRTQLLQIQPWTPFPNDDHLVIVVQNPR